MYAAETQDSTGIALNEQLAKDASGEIKDQWLDELDLAARQIATALNSETDAAAAQTLRNLLEAVRLGEKAITEVWRSFHG
jgi:hypothetical protein